MKRSKTKLKSLIIFSFLLIAFALQSRPISAQTNSNENSANDTAVVKKSVVDNCGRALEELNILDRLVESKNAEIKLLQERVELEKEKFALVREIADSRVRQAESLTEANNALKEALAAKDKQLENKDKEIEILKKKKMKIGTIIKAIGTGVAIGLILK